MPRDPFLAQSQDQGGPQMPSLKAGQRLFNRRYELKQALGAGGMGVVWLARDGTEEIDVALKFLPSVLVLQEREMQRLREEVRAGKELRHPRLVATYGMELEDGVAAIVMEYVPGQTLRQKLDDEPRGFLEPEEITGWVKDICDGLSYLHEEAKRIHRDLKPANVVIDGEGRAKLMDFGISHRIKESVSRHGKTSDGQANGSSSTLAYASPQQISGKPSDKADDIYSLGATMYELLTGTPPFFRGGLDAVALQTKTEPVTPLMERRAELVKAGVNGTTGLQVAETVEKAVLACLSKERGFRPADLHKIAGSFSQQIHQPADSIKSIPLSITTLSQRLGVIPEVEKLNSCPSGEIRRSDTKPKHQHRKWLTSAVLGVSGLLLFALYLGYHHSKPTRPLRHSQPLRPYIKFISLAMDGKRVHTTFNVENGDDRSRVFDLDAPKDNIQVYRAFVSALSEDGNTLVAHESIGKTLLEAFDLTDRQNWKSLWSQATKSIPLAEVATSVALSKDGRVAATGHYKGAVKIWDTSTGKLKRALMPSKDWWYPGHEDAEVSNIVLSSDGLIVASSQREISGIVSVWNADSGTPLKQLWTFTAGDSKHTDSNHDLSLSADGSTIACSAGLNEMISIFKINGTDEPTNHKTDGNVTCLKLTRDGSRLAYGTMKRVILLDTATGKELGSVQQNCALLDISSSGHELLCSDRHDMVLWHVADGGLISQPLKLDPISPDK